MSELRKYRLGEIIEVVGGGIPKTTEPKYWNGNIPWLSVVDFNKGKKFVYETEKYISIEGLKNSSTKLLSKGDIIISARGTVGVVAVLGREMAFNQSCYGIKPLSLVDKEYLYYLLVSCIQKLKYNSHGGVFDTITRETFNTIDVLLPSLEEQKCIASILSSLDDKIDLLYRENKTLEAMAETLFNKTLSEKENNGTIEQLISIQNGYAFKSKDFQERGVNGVIKIKNISGGVIDINKTDCVGNDIIQGISSKFKVHTGDILIAMTGAEIGKLGIIPSTNKDLWLNQRVGMLVERYPGAKYIAYLQLRSDYGLDYVENTATGSAQPNISSSAIENCAFPLLDVSEIKALAYQLEGLYEKIIHNLGHINGLKLLRNELLLKLMNSQV